MFWLPNTHESCLAGLNLPKYRAVTQRVGLFAAVFCGPRPAMLVVPQRVDDWWVRDISAVLGWGDVEVHSGIAGDGRVSGAILARPDLLERLTSRGLPVLPWGRTAAFEPIAPSPGGVVEAIRRYESKRHAHALFRALASDHPGIVVLHNGRAAHVARSPGSWPEGRG
ncbi:hypothetical protein JOF56_000893 [Kibdelosporangium banguiense]|uniref:Uncharacterized protein n=1 Tax=Kibdelosporangium banguiense TaxID=1365924 RepID=A0ABS4T7V9_9PSEU|nr:hypothetical protein [Kibdelosporangium banguiense]MBP2320508.1 hypothetical protein [Kibdelosporangium banguiense]